MLYHSPHATHSIPPSKPTPPIITNIIIANGTRLDKSLYSLDYVKQVFDYFNDQSWQENLLNHLHAGTFIRYLEKASNNSIQYIKKCPQDPNCNPEQRLIAEFSFLEQIIIFLNKQISENNDPRKRAPAEASLHLQGKEIRNLIFDLAETTNARQFSNLTNDVQQRITGEFLIRLPENCLDIIYGRAKHPKITSSNPVANTTEVPRRTTTTSNKAITFQETTPSTLTSQHTALSTNQTSISHFFSTSASRIPSAPINITNTLLENSSAYDESNTTLTTPLTTIVPSDSIFLPSYRLAYSAVMGAAMPVINEGFDLFSDICLRNCSAQIRRCVTPLINTLKFCGISTAYLIYPLVSTLADETDSKAIEWKIVVFLSTTLLSVASHYLASRYNRSLYAKVLLPFYMALNFLTAGDTTTALWCYLANTISSSISLLVIRCVKGNGKNIENTRTTFELEEKELQAVSTISECEPFLESTMPIKPNNSSYGHENTALLNGSSSSSSSTSRADSGSDDSSDSAHFSNDSNSSNESSQAELLPLTAKDCQLYLKEVVAPQLNSLPNDIQDLQKSIAKIRSFNLDLTRTSLSKPSKALLSIPLAKQKLQTRDGHNVEAGLNYVYEFIGPLTNFIQSISNENIYNLNPSVVESVTREFIYIRSILAEIKNLVAAMKSLEKQVPSLPKQKKKTSSQTGLINAIDEKLKALLNKIPETAAGTSTTNEAIANKQYDSSRPPIHFLTKEELSALRKNFNELNDKLAKLETLSEVTLEFQESLDNISKCLFQKFYDFSCLKYPNYESMLKDKNVAASVSFFNTIIQQLTSIQSNTSLKNFIPNDETLKINKKALKITGEINEIIAKMKKTIDSMQHRFEYKQSFSKGRRAGLAQAAKEELTQASATPKRSTLGSYFFQTSQEDNQENSTVNVLLRV
jgi:hypothetical protein